MKNRVIAVASALKTHGFVAGVFALVAIVAGALTAGPAIAQAVRAVLVTNVDDPGRIPYQVTGNCDLIPGDPGQISCLVVFSKVPAGKRLVITNVSGYVGTIVPANSLVLVSVGSSKADLDYLPTTFQGAGNYYNFYVFNQPAHIFCDAGMSPEIAVTINKNNYIHSVFHLAGYMLDCSTGPCAAIATS